MHQQKFLLAKRFLLSVSVVSGMGLLAILPNSALAQDMPEATPTPTPTTPLPSGTTPAATPSAIPEPTPAPEPVSGEAETETEAEGVLVEETEVIDTEAVTEEPTEDALGVEAVTTPDGGTAPATETPAATPVSNPATTNSSPRALW